MLMTRALTLDTPPAVDFLEDAVVWDHLRIETTGSPAVPVDETTLIAAYRDAAQSYLDGAAGILGRALVTQTWVMKLDAFPWEGWAHPVGWRRNARDAAITIPLPPLQSVSSVQYIDPNGVEQTLDASKYQVLQNGARPSQIAPAYDEAWPSTRDQPLAVTITFVAGYGDAASDVPSAIRSAGLLMISDLYQNREAQSVGYEMQPNPAVDRLIAPYRILYA